MNKRFNKNNRRNNSIKVQPKNQKRFFSKTNKQARMFKKRITKVYKKPVVMPILTKVRFPKIDYKKRFSFFQVFNELPKTLYKRVLKRVLDRNFGATLRNKLYTFYGVPISWGDIRVRNLVKVKNQELHDKYQQMFFTRINQLVKRVPKRNFTTALKSLKKNNKLLWEKVVFAFKYVQPLYLTKVLYALFKIPTNWKELKVRKLYAKKYRRIYNRNQTIYHKRLKFLLMRAKYKLQKKLQTPKVSANKQIQIIKNINLLKQQNQLDLKTLVNTIDSAFAINRKPIKKTSLTKNPIKWALSKPQKIKNNFKLATNIKYLPLFKNEQQLKNLLINTINALNNPIKQNTQNLRLIKVIKGAKNKVNLLKRLCNIFLPKDWNTFFLLKRSKLKGFSNKYTRLQQVKYVRLFNIIKTYGVNARYNYNTILPTDSKQQAFLLSKVFFTRVFKKRMRNRFKFRKGSARFKRQKYLRLIQKKLRKLRHINKRYLVRIWPFSRYWLRRKYITNRKYRTYQQVLDQMQIRYRLKLQRRKKQRLFFIYLRTLQPVSTELPKLILPKNGIIRDFNKWNELTERNLSYNKFFNFHKPITTHIQDISLQLYNLYLTTSQLKIKKTKSVRYSNHYKFLAQYSKLLQLFYKNISRKKYAKAVPMTRVMKLTRDFMFLAGKKHKLYFYKDKDRQKERQVKVPYKKAPLSYLRKKKSTFKMKLLFDKLFTWLYCTQKSRVRYMLGTKVRNGFLMNYLTQNQFIYKKQFKLNLSHLSKVNVS